MRSILALLSAQALFLNLVPPIFAVPLELHLPPLLHSAALNSTTLPLVNTTNPGPSACFEPLPGRLPANYEDCVAAISSMRNIRDTRIYTFGRGSRATYTLPRNFHRGTCLLTLDMVYEEQTDRMSFSDIRQAALLLALRCTGTPSFRWGGIRAVPPNNILWITMLGVDPPPSSVS